MHLPFLMVSSWLLLLSSIPWAMGQNPAQPQPDSPTSLTVTGALDRALSQNIPLQQAGIGVQQGVVDVRQAKLDYLPRLSASIDYDRRFGTSFDFVTFQRVEQNSTFSNPSLRLNLPLFNGFSKYYRLRGTEATLQAQVSGYQNQQDVLLTDVLSQFLLIVFDRVDTSVVNQRIQQLDQQLLQTRARFRAGTANEADVVNLEAQRAQESATLLRSVNNLKRDELALRQLLNIKPQEPITFIIPAEERVTQVDTLLPPLQPILDYALENQAMVQEQRYRDAAAQLAIQEARASLYPTVSLTAGLNSSFTSNGGIPVTTESTNSIFLNGQEFVFTDAEGNPTTSAVQTGERVRTGYIEQLEDNFNQSFSIGVSVPIFSGYQVRRNVELAKLQAENTGLNLENTENQLRQIIEQAYLDAETAAEQVRALERQQQASQRAYEIIRVQYEAGAATYFDFLQALNSVTQAQLQLRQARYDLFFKRNILDFYAGETLSF